MVSSAEDLERRINKVTLYRRNLLLHNTILFLESVSNMLWTFFFKSECQRYNILELEKDGKTPEQKFFGVEFHFLPAKYHTQGCPTFILESPLQGGPSGLSKWEPTARIGVYLVHFTICAGSVSLVLNTRTWHVS